MNTSDFLDGIMTDTLEVSTTDGNYTALRAKILRRTQQAVDFVWNFDDWDFKQATGSSMTLTAGNYSCVAPSGFYQLGHNGSLWLLNPPIELIGYPALFVNRARRVSASPSAQPTIFAVSGQDSSTKRPKFIFDTVAGQNYSLELDHEIIRPTLADSAIAGSNGLDQIPDEHARSVLIPAVTELVASDQGDGRVLSELGPRGMAALKQMKAHRDQTRPDEHRLGDLGLRTYQMH